MTVRTTRSARNGARLNVAELAGGSPIAGQPIAQACMYTVIGPLSLVPVYQGTDQSEAERAFEAAAKQ